MAGSLPAQYSVNEFIASSTPFFTPSSSSKSPTTSFAANGLNSSSPPVFSLTVAAQALKVARPTPAGHEVCTFQVVVAAFAVPMNEAPRTPAVAAAPARTNVRRPAAGVEVSLLMCLLWLFWIRAAEPPPRAAPGRVGHRGH